MKYFLYSIVFIILLRSISLFASMKESPTIETLLRQLSSVMVNHDTFRKLQEK